jgi:hypothetical protein
MNTGPIGGPDNIRGPGNEDWDAGDSSLIPGIGMTDPAEVDMHFEYKELKLSLDYLLLQPGSPLISDLVKRI